MPTLAEIVANKKVRGLGTSKQPELAVQGCRAETIDVVMSDATIAPLPVRAAIVAYHDSAMIDRRECQVRRWKNDRADVRSLERAHRNVPLRSRSAPGSPHHDDTVCGSDQHLLGGRTRGINRCTAVCKCYRH